MLNVTPFKIRYKRQSTWFLSHQSEKRCSHVFLAALPDPLGAYKIWIQLKKMHQWPRVITTSDQSTYDKVSQFCSLLWMRHEPKAINLKNYGLPNRFSLLGLFNFCNSLAIAFSGSSSSSSWVLSSSFSSLDFSSSSGQSSSASLKDFQFESPEPNAGTLSYRIKKITDFSDGLPFLALDTSYPDTRPIDIASGPNWWPILRWWY